MSEVTLRINNRGYNLACDPGQEERLLQLSAYIDERLEGIQAAGAASDNAHLLVLTSLVLADEVFEMREKLVQGSRSTIGSQEEEMIARVIGQLAEKIERISARMSQGVPADTTQQAEPSDNAYVA